MTQPLFTRIALSGLLAVSAAVCPVVHAETATPAVDVAAFEQLKSLAGRWEGDFEAPAKGAATIEYEVTSNGRAVIEHQFRGSSHAMISVFALAYDRLQGSHFCAMGNQPAYRLAQGSTPHDIRMEFVGGTGLDPDKDHHANGERIEVVGPDELRVTFEFRTGHEPPTSASMRLKRVSTAAALSQPAGEPADRPSGQPTDQPAAKPSATP